ncbi:Glutathione s-transferase [Thalictrum thalictroides]|uniref:Glutathione S-transferase n=1 Tax=Thalictrum thalictroides TaxID=46969 RepID=A0A7J6UX79_THATH|nr:Glutathione s-transferase [Thalictrum thalictroides]
MAAAAATNLKVIGAWASPFAMRPRIALNVKNVDYEYLEETFAPKSELLLKSNPVHKKVPVMIHNDQPICESLVIVQYIDEIFTSGSSLLPSDPYDRAIARFWATYIDNTWFSSLVGIAKAKTDEEKATASEGLTAGLALLEEAFEKISKGKGFFGGKTIGYVDIALGSCLGWIRVAETLSGSNYIDETITPGLNAWADRFSSDDAVKDLIPDTEKLLGFAKRRFGSPAK